MTQPHHKIKQTVLSECHSALTISSTGTYSTDVNSQRESEHVLAFNKRTGFTCYIRSPLKEEIPHVQVPLV